MAEVASITWLDWALIATLILSMAVGLARGVAFELMSLAGWVVAWFAAQWGAPQVAAHVPVGSEGSALNLTVSFVLCFLAALVLWSLLARLVRMLVRAMPLSAIDRVLGAGFGLLRGVVVLLVVASIVALTPAADSPAWAASQGVAWLSAALQVLKPLLPPRMSALLPA